MIKRFTATVSLTVNTENDLDENEMLAYLINAVCLDLDNETWGDIGVTDIDINWDDLQLELPFEV